MTRRRFLLPPVFAAAAFGAILLTAPPAQSQVPSDETFESADGVKLHGRFYKAQANKNNSCVLLLPGFKKDPTKGHWDDLAKLLAKEGYNTLILHYRGHGKSTDVSGKEFYSNPYLGGFNQRWVSGAKKTPPRSTIGLADLRMQYAPMLVNDVMAARSFLERKNDTGEVNIGTFYLIGAGEACPLGLLYIAAEWHREAIQPNIALPPPFVNGNRGVMIPPNADPAGKDIAACIWLTPERTPSLQDGVVKSFVSRYAPSMREETRMLFLHGEKDDTGKRNAKYFYDEVLVAKGKKVGQMELTEIRAIKNAKQLGGVDLLGKNDSFGTEDTILKYLRAIDDDRKGRARFNRGYAKPLPVVLQSFGINP